MLPQLWLHKQAWRFQDANVDEPRYDNANKRWSCGFVALWSESIQGGPKTDNQFYFWSNFGNSAPIFTVLSLLQAEIYGA